MSLPVPQVAKIIHAIAKAQIAFAEHEDFQWADRSHQYPLSDVELPATEQQERPLDVLLNQSIGHTVAMVQELCQVAHTMNSTSFAIRAGLHNPDVLPGPTSMQTPLREECLEFLHHLIEGQLRPVVELPPGVAEKLRPILQIRRPVALASLASLRPWGFLRLHVATPRSNQRTPWNPDVRRARAELRLCQLAVQHQRIPEVLSWSRA